MNHWKELDYKEKLREMIAREYEKGYTVPELSELFDIKESTLYHWLHEREVDMRNGGPRLSEVEQEKIMDLFEEGVGATKIARTLNHKVDTVKYYIIVNSGFDGEFDDENKGEKK